jgi:hypothetical protein
MCELAASARDFVQELTTHSCFVCGCVDSRYRFLEVKEMVDEDVVALMYEFEMERKAIESYKEGTHADLMEMAQSFLDLSTYSFQSTMGVGIACLLLSPRFYVLCFKVYLILHIMVSYDLALFCLLRCCANTTLWH